MRGNMANFDHRKQARVWLIQPCREHEDGDKRCATDSVNKRAD